MSSLFELMRTMEDKIEGLVYGEREQIRHDDEIVLVVRISTLEMLIEDIQGLGFLKPLLPLVIMDMINNQDCEAYDFTYTPSDTELPVDTHSIIPSYLYAGNLPLCKRCILHHKDLALSSVQNCTRRDIRPGNWKNRGQLWKAPATSISDLSCMWRERTLQKSVPKSKQPCPWKSILAEGQERSPRPERSHSQGIHVDIAKIKAVKDWATPTTPIERQKQGFALKSGGLPTWQGDMGLGFSGEGMKFLPNG
ncbi:hypothetical protein Tco_0007612 [Tanacetum coccineum]